LLATKTWLAVWYHRAGIHPLAEVRPLLRPLLAGVDLLCAGALCVAMAAVMIPARWLRRGQFLFVSALPFAIHAAVVTLAVVSLKVNQLYGRPISFDLLDYASDLGVMRESIVSTIDAQTIVFALFGLALYWAGPLLFARPLRRVGTRLAWVAVLAIALGSGALAARTFKSVYAYGLKSNGLIELARSYRGAASELDYAHQHRQLADALAPIGGADVDRHPLSGAHAAAGLPQLAGKARGMNLVLVVLESTAATYVDARTMPALTRVAERGVRFGRHYTSAPFTFDAQYGLFYSHEIRDVSADYHKLYAGPPKDASLFEAFERAGYRTAVFASAYLYFHDQGWLFRGKGVQTLQSAETLVKRRPGQSWGADERDTIDAMTEWLAANRGVPFVAMYNPITPHHPYHAPLDTRPFPGYAIEDNYRNALVYTDQQIARLLQSLDRLGLSEKTVVAAVSDHGESLSVSRGSGHGLVFSDAELHVPFVLAVPGTAPALVSAPTNHLDFAPTIASLFGLAGDAGWEGRDLLRPAIEPRLLYVGIGVGKLAGAIDGARAFSVDLNNGSSHSFRVDPSAFVEEPDASPLARRYRELVLQHDPKLTLRHLDVALGKL
jgi:hypothetical protein